MKELLFMRIIVQLLRFKLYIYSCSRQSVISEKYLDSTIIFDSTSFTTFTRAILKIIVDNIGAGAIAYCANISKVCLIIQEHFQRFKITGRTVPRVNA